MRTRLLAVVGLALSAVSVCAQDRTVELPTLLSPQTAPTPAPSSAPRGTTCEYDHSFLYIPETAPPSIAPPKPPEEARPLGRWWLRPSLDLGWANADTPLPTMRLSVPGIPNAPMLPLQGVTSNLFRVGFDITGGWWCSDRQMNGIDASFNLLGISDRTVTGVAPGMILVFPDGTSRSSPQVIAVPEPLASSFYSTFPATYSTWFLGSDVNYRRGLVRNPNVRLDLLAGYRFGYVADELFLGDVPSDGHDEYKQNRIAVTNQFHGGQLGLAGEWRANVWSLTGTAKVAFGAVTTNVSETGLFVNPDVLSTNGFAPLSQRCVGSKFAVLPTVNATLGRQLGEHGRVFVGYSFQYLNNVARLGDVLDPTTNGGPLRLSDYWVQAVRLGMEWKY